MADSIFLRIGRLALPVLAALVALALLPGLASAQAGQRRQGASLGAEQRAELRRDVVDEQAKRAEQPAHTPRERRLSPEQRLELRRQLREQAREQAGVVRSPP